MTGWIFNASPVILLGKIHQLHLVEALSPSFRIPRAVVKEIGAGCSEDPAVKWLKNPSIAGHIVDTPTSTGVRGQKSEIRNQKSEIGNRKSAIENRKSKIGNRKSLPLPIQNPKFNIQNSLPIRLLVTGSSGLIGSEVCIHFASLGWHFFLLVVDKHAILRP